MNIIEKQTDELRPYANNPRRNEEAVEYVANSIRDFGFKVPIIVDTNNVIVAGHTRYLAAKELGLKTVPCIVADDLTPEQIKAFRIADNKVGELALWDIEKLGVELSALDGITDMTEYGFGDFEIRLLTEEETVERIERQEAASKGDTTKRIIITYEEGNAGRVAELLGLEAIEKDIYRAGELI